MTNTARKRITDAAVTAGLKVTEVPSASSVAIEANDGHRLVADFDRIGRCMGARRRIPGASHALDMPAAGSEARILAWIELHTVAAPAPDSDDAFADMDRSNEAADAFAQGGRSGLEQLDADRVQRTESPLGDVTNVVSGNAVVGSMVGHVGVQLAGRRRSLTPHTFEGRSDRLCDVCHLADRHPVHSAGSTTLDEHRRAARDITVERLYDGFVIVVPLDDVSSRSVTTTQTEAEALRDRLVELLGPGPTDH